VQRIRFAHRLDIPSFDTVRFPATATPGLAAVHAGLLIYSLKEA
jgi:hypothetical protein